MSSLENWSTLQKQWIGKVYQKKSKEWRRLAHFEERIAPFFSCRRVVDVGCNAGLMALPLCKCVSHYTGVEMDDVYYAQTAETAKMLFPGRFDFVHGDAVKYLTTHVGDYDALLLSCILYHLPDLDLELMATVVLPSVDFAVVYGRYYRPTIKNTYALEKPENNRKLFESCGFEVRNSSIKHPDLFCLICERKPK